MSQSLHPDVKRFKAFVKKRPYVLRDVNSGEKTLQDIFEEWMLFGEEDDIWESYLKDDDEKDETKKSDEEDEEDSNVDVLNMLKNMNLNDIQHHLGQFSTVVQSVQELVSQFKQQQTPDPSQGPPEQQSPFSFTED
ncbi:YlbD family protein [Salipaludibacillus agaradhaerens]|uniref:YlbD family protein n=1 Tax=Salipaludibacillus agaradhaerens TaxID=76935 RepID=UPI002150B5C7|nr:YlbD family protein [Salipaludibacillus agaradhaerens]MCR6119223.1 YlbD family protein [Salipaludibacillus agaradhaerens]UJW58264.1 YlbD family protein [Bacillus sp. A116_S68]